MTDPYAQPPTQHPVASQVDHPDGNTVMIMGVLGVAFCQILAPIAWIRGNRVLHEIDERPDYYSNRGTVNVGRICGMVGTILLGVYVVVVLLAVLLTTASRS